MPFAGVLRLDGGSGEAELPGLFRLKPRRGDEGPVSSFCGPFALLSFPPFLVRDHGSIVVGGWGRSDGNMGERSGRDEGGGLAFLDLVAAKGEAGLPSLKGDWLCLRWREAEQELLLARSLPGGADLVHFLRPGRSLHFASSLADLLVVLDASPSVDLDDLACLAAFRPSRDGTATPFRGVRRLAAGSLLRCRDGRVEPRDFGSWMDLEKPPEGDEATLERASRLFEKAVEDRLGIDGPVGITLSSGFDSTAVFALAAPALARQGRRLVAVTWAPREEGGGGAHGAEDEAAAAAALCRRHENVDHHVLRSPKRSLLASALEALDFAMEPSLACLHWAGRLEMAKLFGDVGVFRVLTGGMGNMTLSWNGGRSWMDLLSSPQVLVGVKDLLRTLLRPKLLRAGARRMWRQFRSPRRSEVLPISFLRRALVDGPALQETLAGWKRLERAGAADLRRAVLRWSATRGGASLKAFAERHRLEHVDPTGDEDFVAFCLSLPPEQTFRYGHGRFLARRLVPRLLGDPTWRRQPRGQACPDRRERLVHDLPLLRELLDGFGGCQAVPELLDVKAMEDAVRRLAEDAAQVSRGECDALILAVQIGEFLRRRA